MIVVAAILIAVGSVWLVRHIWLADRPEVNTAIPPFMTVVAVVYGALLGFSVIGSWQHFSTSETVVANEASTLATLYRQTVALPEPEQTQLKQLLRRYQSDVANVEWLKQGSSDAVSGSAQAAITEMYRIIGNQPPSVASRPIQAAFLDQLSELANYRAVRVIETKSQAPPLLRSALIFGAIVLVVLMSFARLGSMLVHTIVSSVIAVLLGLLLCVFYSLNHPFGVDRGITSEPFQRSLEVFDAVDKSA